MLTHIIQEDACRIVNSIDYQWFDGKRVLVTGGTGLLGTYFLACFKEMQEQGCHVDVTYTTRTERVNNRYFPQLVRGMNSYQLDLTDRNRVESLPSVNCIIHAAGYGQPVKFMANPQETVLLNTSTVMALHSLLYPSGKFLFLSSSEVYSGNSCAPHTEGMIGTTTPQHQRAVYIEAKRCGEALCHSLNGRTQTYRIGRVSLSYGPGTQRDDTRVLNDFMRQAIADGQIVMKDSGHVWRTYCYVTDTVEMLFNALLNGQETVYNIGGQSRTTIRDLAGKIADIAGVPFEAPNLCQADESAPQLVEMNIDKILKIRQHGCDLVSLTAGLKRTYEWQNELYS